MKQILLFGLIFLISACGDTVKPNAEKRRDAAYHGNGYMATESIAYDKDKTQKTINHREDGSIRTITLNNFGLENPFQITTHYDKDGHEILTKKWSVGSPYGCFDKSSGPDHFVGGLPADGEFKVWHDDMLNYSWYKVKDGRILERGEGGSDFNSREMFDSQSCRFLSSKTTNKYGVMVETFLFEDDSVLRIWQRDDEIMLICGQLDEELIFETDFFRDVVKKLSGDEAKKLLEKFDRENPKNICH